MVPKPDKKEGHDFRRSLDVTDKRRNECEEGCGRVMDFQLIALTVKRTSLRAKILKDSEQLVEFCVLRVSGIFFKLKKASIPFNLLFLSCALF